MYHKKKPAATWTILFIVSGENNLINESIKCIEEIYAAGSNDKVNFLILFDGLEMNKFSPTFSRPSLYEVKTENGFLIDRPVHISRSENLAGMKILRFFFSYIKKEYKARNYGVIYKGHGGPGETDISSAVYVEKIYKINPNWSEEKIDAYLSEKRRYLNYEGSFAYYGFSRKRSDASFVTAIYSKRRYREEQTLTYRKLATSLYAIFGFQGLGFICLDCCWGQQIENAFTFSPVTKNFIASADEMPALGLGYKEFCSKIIQREEINDSEVARMLVAVFYYRNYADYDSEIEEFRKMGVSVTHTSTIKLLSAKATDTESLQYHFKQMCDHIIKKMPLLCGVIHTARSKCRDYTYRPTEDMEVEKIDYPMYNIDLIWFLENVLYYLKQNDYVLGDMIKEVLSLLQNDIISSFLSSNYKKAILGRENIGGNGITITFPANREQFKGSLANRRYNLFNSLTGWNKLLIKYYDTLDRLKEASSPSNLKWNNYIAEYYQGDKKVDNNIKSGGNFTEIILDSFKSDINKQSESRINSQWNKIYKTKQ